MPQTARYAFAVLASLSIATGCARQLNNPWVDSGAWANADMTTPSAEGFLRMHEPVARVSREWPRCNVHGFNGAVTHWPVWWEDPFVDKGNDSTDPSDRDRADTCFAVTWVDYLAIAY